jgi:phage gp36-like protein
MTYATAQDLIDRLGVREATAISDRNKTGQPDLAVLDQALALAQDEVNGYVGRRYALPLQTSAGQLAATPSMLTRLVIDITRYRQTGTEIMETEAIRNRFKDALKVLEQIAKGEISLGDLMLATAGGPAAVGGNTTVRAPAKGFGNLSQVL